MFEAMRNFFNRVISTISNSLYNAYNKFKSYFVTKKESKIAVTDPVAQTEIDPYGVKPNEFNSVSALERMVVYRSPTLLRALNSFLESKKLSADFTKKDDWIKDFIENRATNSLRNNIENKIANDWYNHIPENTNNKYIADLFSKYNIGEPRIHCNAMLAIYGKNLMITLEALEQAYRGILKAENGHYPTMRKCIGFIHKAILEFKNTPTNGTTPAFDDKKTAEMSFDVSDEEILSAEAYRAPKKNTQKIS